MLKPIYWLSQRKNRKRFCYNLWPPRTKHLLPSEHISFCLAENAEIISILKWCFFFFLGKLINERNFYLINNNWIEMWMNISGTWSASILCKHDETCWSSLYTHFGLNEFNWAPLIFELLPINKKKKKMIRINHMKNVYLSKHIQLIYFVGIFVCVCCCCHWEQRQKDLVHNTL